MMNNDLQKKVHSMSLVLSFIGALATMTVFSVHIWGTNSTLSSMFIGSFASVMGAAIAVFVAKLFRGFRKRPKVFISYAHNDSEFVMKLVGDLMAMEVGPIVDQLELRVGDDIRSAIDNMIERCDFFLMVISNDMARSNWAKKELDQATSRKKKILPVVLAKDAVPESLSCLYYADFCDDYDRGISQLKTTLGVRT